MVHGVFSIPLPGHAGGGATTSNAGRPLADFVAGPENAVVAKVIRSYLDQADETTSLLVFYGPSGSGKSHLARGLTGWWQKHHPGKRALCLTGAEFAQAYGEAVRDDCLSGFRIRLRQLTLLVVDDIQQLAAKRGAQDELRHTLDALADRRALVVVTARELPAHSRALLSGLRSRLSAGLNLSLALPGPRTRRVLVKRLAEARGLTVPDGALDKLADAIKDGVPALLSALMELELAAQGERRWDAGHVRKLVAQRKTAGMPSLRAIAGLTARYFGLTVAQLKSPMRRQALVTARGMAMYLARELTDKSLDEIGSFFGGRDHSTVLHSCRRVQKLVAEDRGTRLAAAELKRLLVTP